MFTYRLAYNTSPSVDMHMSRGNEIGVKKKNKKKGKPCKSLFVAGVRSSSQAFKGTPPQTLLLPAVSPVYKEFSQKIPMLNPIESAWSCLKAAVKRNLSMQLPQILAGEDRANTPQYEYRLRHLENLVSSTSWTNSGTNEIICSFRRRYFSICPQDERYIHCRYGNENNEDIMVMMVIIWRIIRNGSKEEANLRLNLLMILLLHQSWLTSRTNMSNCFRAKTLADAPTTVDAAAVNLKLRGLISQGGNRNIIALIKNSIHLGARLLKGAFGFPIGTYHLKFNTKRGSRSDIPQAPIGYITANLSVPQLKLMLPGSYIMEIPRGLKKQTRPWIIQMLRRMNVNIYNPKARLVIVVNWYPVGDVFGMVAVLLEWSYEFAFSDAIVVVPRRGKYNKLTNLDVFGWLPEDERDICLLQVKIIRRFNTWLVEKKSFACNRHLFPVKRMRNKYHCYIKAHHGSTPPFVYYNKGKVVGSMVELVNYAVNLVAVEHAMKKKHDPVHSILLPLTIEPTHELSICKLTYPLFNVDCMWYVPVGHKVAPWRTLYKAFYL
ncbi:hypothetical protein C0J52_23087 [Blattella germanica]|nr:hypothetical protein C0J52_23087 [Blattella germanica]